MSTSLTPTCKASVITTQGGWGQAIIEPAKQVDMPTGWICKWTEIWQRTDFECEAIIKISYEEKMQGLVRFALYPYTGDATIPPEYLEIRNLEAIHGEDRKIDPVGYWLIWYAIQVALRLCEGDANGSLVTVDSLEDGYLYYRDKVKMDELGWTTISPTEDGYAFRFTKEGAKGFCRRLEAEYGHPVIFD